MIKITIKIRKRLRQRLWINPNHILMVKGQTIILNDVLRTKLKIEEMPDSFIDRLNDFYKKGTSK